ncbi:hypothetical protein [Pseudomonas sp. GXZC]|uniref:hypothetical protein n=1 Tax=Pseudomonas sp. GXZC TaxID=3003351 RepID=UPI0022AA733D|nr:hypothetical protein [Pseudomonas sp. GXZC]WAT26318.1 hypothetical protein OZ428_20290 [Pseudomonas sp. GXZC]
MSNQAQVDALEHLLIAVLSSTPGAPKDYLIEKAQGSLAGSDGPGGPEQKLEAGKYLAYIASRIR